MDRAAVLVREASTMARRLGAGHLAVSRFAHHEGRTICGIHEALSVLGRMMAWCQEQQRVEPLTVDVAGLADMLRVSERKLWEMNSRHLLPKPVRFGKSVRWVLKEIQAWLTAGSPSREQWEKLKTKGTTP